MHARELNRSFHSSDEEAELDAAAEKAEYEEMLRNNKTKAGVSHGTGAEDDEMKGLSREEQLKRMGHMAQNFNFYSMEKSGAKPRGRPKI